MDQEPNESILSNSHSALFVCLLFLTSESDCKWQQATLSDIIAPNFPSFLGLTLLQVRRKEIKGLGTVVQGRGEHGGAESQKVVREEVRGTGVASPVQVHHLPRGEITYQMRCGWN